MRYLYSILFGLVASSALAAPYLGNYPDTNADFYFFTNTVGTTGAPVTILSETVNCLKDGNYVTPVGGVTISKNAAFTGQHRITVDLNDSDYVVGSTYTVYYSGGTADGILLTGRVIATFYLGPKDSNLTQINGSLTTGNNATLSLKSIDVRNNAGNAVNFISSVVNSSGLYCRGYGIGSGIHCEGGTDGISSEGFGNGAGLALTGGKLDYDGTHINGTLDTVESDNFGPGLDAIADGNGPGMKLRGGNGETDTYGGIYGSSTNTAGSADDGGGWGLECIATGDSAAGAYFKAAVGSNAQGASFNGVGTGAGIISFGGPDGHGVSFLGGTNTGNGINSVAQNAAGKPARGVHYVSQWGTAVTPYNNSTLGLSSTASTADNFYNRQLLVLTGGTGAGQAAIIDDYTGAGTKSALIKGLWTTTPDATTTYEIWPLAQTVSEDPTLASITSAVSSELTFTESTVAAVYSILSGAATFNDLMAAAGATTTRLAKLDAPVLNVSADAADNFDRSAKSIVTGTVVSSTTSGGTNVITVSTMDPPMVQVNQFVGREMIFDENTISADLRGQATDVISNTTSTITVTVLTDPPASGDTFTLN